MCRPNRMAPLLRGPAGRIRRTRRTSNNASQAVTVTSAFSPRRARHSHSPMEGEGGTNGTRHSVAALPRQHLAAGQALRSTHFRPTARVGDVHDRLGRYDARPHHPGRPSRLGSSLARTDAGSTIAARQPPMPSLTQQEVCAYAIGACLSIPSKTASRDRSPHTVKPRSDGGFRVGREGYQFNLGPARGKARAWLDDDMTSAKAPHWLFWPTRRSMLARPPGTSVKTVALALDHKCFEERNSRQPPKTPREAST
jgi:hypothetical protein